MRTNSRRLLEALAGVLAFAFAVVEPVGACTTFSYFSITSASSEKVRVFGKVFDWQNYHGLIVVNPRGVAKSALNHPLLSRALGLDASKDRPLEWTSRFGSVTFNQHGIGFPLGGMNEVGLVVEIMIGPAKHSTDKTKPFVNEIEYIQWLLDSFASIEELSAHAEEVRIVRISKNVHYLVCDIGGECAAVEFLDGQLKLHRSTQDAAGFPGEKNAKAFANAAYEESFAQYRSGVAGASRFSTAASMAQEMEGHASGFTIQALRDRAWEIFNEVTLTGQWVNYYEHDREIVHQTLIPGNDGKYTTKRIDFSVLRGSEAFACRTEGARVIHGGLPLVNSTGDVLGAANTVEDVTEKLREALPEDVNEMVSGQDRELLAAIESRAGRFREELARLGLTPEALPARFVQMLANYPGTMVCAEETPSRVTITSGSLVGG